MSRFDIRSNVLRPDRAVRERLANASSASETDLSIDGTTPVNFRYTAPANTVVELTRCSLGLVDGSVDVKDFGAVTGTLSNGLEVKIFDSAGNVLIDLLDGETIKTNGQFGKLASTEVTYNTGSGDDDIYARWDLAEEFGSPIVLYPGEYFNVKVQDDLSALTDFWWVVAGRSHKMS